jgi:uncharacterized protein
MSAQMPQNNRVKEIDIIRGFALFGVLLVNLTMIDATMYSYVSSAFDLTDPMARFSALLIHLFAVGKFYTLFSILFGLGFYYFMNKQDGTSISESLFKRRLTALFFFGILHLVFVWYGDILHVYAITGAILLKNRSRNIESLIKTAFMLFILSTLMFVWFRSSGGTQGDISAVIQEAENAYSQTSYFSMLQYRLTHELPLIAFNFMAVLPKILSLFLFGYYIGKRQILSAIEDHLPLIRRTWRLSGIIALICGIGYILLMGVFTSKSLDLMSVVFDELLTISGALFYATSLILLYQNAHFKRFVSPLQFSGKMALTNYLAQTIFFTTLINGYGAGLHGKIPYWAYFPIALLFYLIQIGLSKWWLSHHAFGPMEKVWRKFTYWQSR